MSWSVTGLENYVAGGGATSTTKSTAALTVAANSVVLVWGGFDLGFSGGHWTGNSVAITDSVDGATGWNTLENKVLAASDAFGKSYLWYKKFTSGGTYTITFTSTVATYYGYAVVQVTGADTSTPIVQSKSQDSPNWQDGGNTHSLDVTLDANPTSGNAVIWFSSTNNDSAGASTLPSGYTQIYNNSTGGFEKNDAAYNTATTTALISCTDLGQQIEWAIVGAVELTVPLTSGPPGQVTGLTATASGATQVDLSWTAPSPGGASISDYLVEYSLNGSSFNTFSHSAQTATTITVTGLSQATLYYFRVSAINSIGTGTASSNQTATTWDVPAQVTGVTVTPYYGQMLLSWTAPADGGTAITGYKVEYSTNSGGSWSNASANTGTTATTYTHTSLTLGTNYRYRISAINAVGTGTASSSTSDYQTLDPAFTIILEDGTSPLVLEDGTSPLVGEG